MADITPLRTAAETGLSKLFEATRMKYPTGVSIAREEAFRYFEAVGLPTRRVEAFKYTDLRAAITEAAPPAKASCNMTLQEAVAGEWRLRADHRSPRYTTRISDLPTVRV
mgnify:CR=1 FL=1